MKKMQSLIIFTVLLINVLISTRTASACNLSDREAIDAAVSFYKKSGAILSNEPWVFRKNYILRMDNSEVKEVVIGERGDFKGFIKVACNNKEVVYYDNSDLEQRVRKKYKISNVTTEPRNWPPFLSENKAKEIIFSIARRIGFPPDVEFAQLGLDKENGTWSGYWHRKYNGYKYEIDSIRIQIMAVDGEFYSYGKTYFGKPCPTEVKVNKEEAVEEGWRNIARLFGKSVDWGKNKRDYEIKSAELQIIQPNTLAGQIVRQHSTESRLAWVIVFGLKTTPDPKKLDEVNYLKRIMIKIDAASKKFLGGDFTQ